MLNKSRAKIANLQEHRLFRYGIFIVLAQSCFNIAPLLNTTTNAMPRAVARRKDLRHSV